MNWIRSIFKNETIQLHIHLDPLESINKNPILLKVTGDTNLATIRSQIAEQEKCKETDLFWFINNHFRSDETILADLFEDVEPPGKYYEIHIIQISENERQNINYNLELFLQEKYASLNNKKQNTKKQNNEQRTPRIERKQSVELMCPMCKTTYPINQKVFFDLCKHEMCKKCATNSILNFGKNSVKCPNPECSRNLFDYEIQKILDTTDYKIFQKSVVEESEKNHEFVVPKIGWSCKSCTFFNYPFERFCEVCADNCPDEYHAPTYWKPTTEESKKMEKKIEMETLANEMESIRILKEKDDQMKRLEMIKQLAKEEVTMTRVTIECPICLMDYEPGEAIVLHSCLHTICKECFRNYLINIENPQVKCPTENCIGLVEDQEIRAMLSKTEYSKYQELGLRMAEAREKQAFHCKEINCTAWIIYDGNVFSFTCPLCKKVNCIPCQAIHEDMTCREYLEKRATSDDYKSSLEDDKFIQKMIDNGEAMKCPGCGILIQKNKGCDGVICKNCGIMMCWATKGPRWGPKGKGDTSGGCGCRFFWGKKCHPNCHYCH